jgi:hypothetical protein
MLLKTTRLLDFCYIVNEPYGLFTRKSDFALGLQVYNTNSIFLYSKRDSLIAKYSSKIGRVNKPLSQSQN